MKVKQPLCTRHIYIKHEYQETLRFDDGIYESEWVIVGQVIRPAGHCERVHIRGHLDLEWNRRQIDHQERRKGGIRAGIERLYNLS